MGKIVVFATGKDADAAQAALEAANLDFQIVPATPKNLLNIVIGMVDPDSLDDKDEDKKEDEPKEPEEETSDEPAPEEEDVGDEGMGADDLAAELGESLSINDQVIKSRFVDGINTTLRVPKVFVSESHSDVKIGDMELRFLNDGQAEVISVSNKGHQFLIRAKIIEDKTLTEPVLCIGRDHRIAKQIV